MTDIFAKAGEAVTTEEGKVICYLKNDLHRHQMVSAGDFERFTAGEPVWQPGMVLDNRCTRSRPDRQGGLQIRINGGMAAMTNEDRRRAADAILHVPFFHELFDEIEKQAIDACIYAKHDDHEARQAHASEVRVIRKLRSRLEAISKEGQSARGRSAPA